jgi:hypothetical protein
MSFRKRKYLSPGVDIRGQVYRLGDGIYREITPDSGYKKLLDDQRLMDELFRIGLVRTHIVRETTATMVLQHQRVHFLSFSIEWSFDMLKDAALMMIALCEKLMEEGYGIKDAHPYNILFESGRPIFVDFSSIVPLSEVPWRAWRSEFIGEFIIPLHLLSRGWKKLMRRYSYWEDWPEEKAQFFNFLGKAWSLYRYLFRRQTSEDSVRLMKKCVEGITLRPYETEWEDYYERGPVPLIADEATYTNKEKSTMEFLRYAKSKGQNTLLDVASNEGWFSFLAESLGFQVVALDYDERAINNLYLKIRGSGKRILPLVMDFTNPTRRHGKNGVWASATDRLRCDVSLSMALIHHLCITQDLSFEEFSNIIASFTNNYAIVEFIDKDDSHIRKRVKAKPWYSEQNFLKAMSGRFILLDELPSEPSTRKVFLFQKKQDLS